METLKVYSMEQMNRLNQFRRAEKIVHTLNENQTIFDHNAWLVIPDPSRGLGLAVDRKQAGMMRAALIGMFEELLEIGMREEITK